MAKEVDVLLDEAAGFIREHACVCVRVCVCARACVCVYVNVCVTMRLCFAG
jgi:hypothetical protein